MIFPPFDISTLQHYRQSSFTLTFLQLCMEEHSVFQLVNVLNMSRDSKQFQYVSFSVGTPWGVSDALHVINQAWKSLPKSKTGHLRESCRSDGGNDGEMNVYWNFGDISCHNFHTAPLPLWHSVSVLIDHSWLLTNQMCCCAVGGTLSQTAERSCVLYCAVYNDMYSIYIVQYCISLKFLKLLPLSLLLSLLLHITDRQRSKPSAFLK